MTVYWVELTKVNDIYNKIKEKEKWQQEEQYMYLKTV